MDPSHRLGLLQGDSSRWSKPPIDIKTKVLFEYEAQVQKPNLCSGVNGRLGPM